MAKLIRSVSSASFLWKVLPEAEHVDKCPHLQWHKQHCVLWFYKHCAAFVLSQWLQQMFFLIEADDIARGYGLIWRYICYFDKIIWHRGWYSDFCQLRWLETIRFLNLLGKNTKSQCLRLYISNWAKISLIFFH